MLKKMLFGLLIGCVLIGLIVFYFYQQVTSPSNSLEDYLQTNNKQDEKTVVMLGDSITEGTVSYDYVDDLNKSFPDHNYTFVNAGHGGDLAYHLNKRLHNVIKAKPDYVVILVGTNDMLGAASEKVQHVTKKAKRLPAEPIDERYKANLTKVVERLQEQTDAEIAVVSPPVLTEEMNSKLFKMSKHYQEIAEAVADKQDVHYLPLHEQQMTFYKKYKPDPKVEFQYGASNIYKSAMRHYLLGEDWNEVSDERGLLLTTDHIHQNARGAEMIKDLVREFLMKTS